MTNPRSAGRLAACAFALSALSGAAHAADVAAGALRISHAWTRPTAAGAPTAAGFLSITNSGKAPERLLGASSPAANRIELHESSMAGGVMSMRPLAGGLAIPPGATVNLAPGGAHMMIIGPKQAFRPGERIPVTLRFQRAGAIRLSLDVEQPGMPGGAMMNMPGPGGHAHH